MYKTFITNALNLLYFGFYMLCSQYFWWKWVLWYEENNLYL